MHLVAVQLWDIVGRHVLLNVTLGLIYGAIAVEGLLARAAQGRALASPLLVLTLVMGMLSLLTGARGFFIGIHGTEVVYRGLYAQVYYAYASLAAVLLGLNLVWMVFVRLNTQLTELASRDALTRVLNRNGLEEVLARHFAERATRPVTLMQVDIDNFKRINDSHGHAAGDLVLREVAGSLNANIRASDFIARVGGEEFLVGCVAADDGVARALADRLLNGVRKLEVMLPGVKMPVRCTVSIGISRRCNERADWELCWAEADRACMPPRLPGATVSWPPAHCRRRRATPPRSGHRRRVEQHQRVVQPQRSAQVRCAAGHRRACRWNSSQPISSMLASPVAMRPASTSIRSCQRRARSLRVATLITGHSARP